MNLTLVWKSPWRLCRRMIAAGRGPILTLMILVGGEADIYPK